ncbi:hypothetical protein L228DRAFT_249321 [Xylona heveae TC161]|uniref:Myb-like DNA-binding domain-containing protein n=1 Tax=Xylona heveae (strain CBS 132557 / TC161) TaxID=1328760 RepID=A0A165AJ52_XYLHT|nr:hypothetical protein L228DRAFT_249321 [Xylona heveae TC161]KZF20565.1 hypothetical protein L228DRAFT_249321 [Xylona heveae TC161]
MATLRRSKTMPTDGPTAKFLYTILKQLDLKSIDWSAVASQLEITNGHAARMRFSRFKQHMEGVVPSPRRRASPKPKKVKTNPDKEKSVVKKHEYDEMNGQTDDAECAPARAIPFIKHERVDDIPPSNLYSIDTTPSLTHGLVQPTVSDHHMMGMDMGMMSVMPIPQQHQVAPEMMPDRKDFGPFAGVYPPAESVIPVRVKVEPRWDEE